MATILEMEQIQMDRLFDLLSLQRDNQGTKIVGLNKQIARAKASMKKENIAWVEKMINELED